MGAHTRLELGGGAGSEAMVQSSATLPASRGGLLLTDLEALQPGLSWPTSRRAPHGCSMATAGARATWLLRLPRSSCPGAMSKGAHL